MEGRVLLTCSDCGRTREIAGELPDEFRDCFTRYVQEEGWLPKPGAQVAFMCGACASKYEGHETRDDAPKATGERDPKEP